MWPFRKSKRRIIRNNLKAIDADIRVLKIQEGIYQKILAEIAKERFPSMIHLEIFILQQYNEHLDNHIKLLGQEYELLEQQ